MLWCPIYDWPFENFIMFLSKSMQFFTRISSWRQYFTTVRNVYKSSFSIHTAVVYLKKQVQAYEECKLEINDNFLYIVLQSDFSQGITFKGQDTSMSTDKYTTRITIFTCVRWYQDSKFCEMIVSDDCGHSKDSIIGFLDRLLIWLPNEIKMIDFWSDSPANQFKNIFAAVMFKQERYFNLVKLFHFEPWDGTCWWCWSCH